ncbi:MAG TPA: hypothetical protein VFZ57_07370, partial [Thermoanaerobaculia bacterium]|nr:hypothetical protein [Thermoanaerobaculia bacterium]
MAISILLYSGLALLALGSVSLVSPPRFLGIATRLQALVVFAAGFLAAAAALAVPTSAARASAREPARIDDFVPGFQFEEFHERIVRATPERIFRAIHDLPAGEIRLFRLLTWMRSPRLPGTTAPESILNPPAKKPILDTALQSGFVLLAEEKDRELVLGTLVARPRGSRTALPAEAAETSRRFAALSAPGYAKAAMNFLVEPRPDGSCRVTTETRIFATDPKTARRFATYWRFIYPGSSLIRRMWL